MGYTASEPLRRGFEGVNGPICFIHSLKTVADTPIPLPSLPDRMSEDTPADATTDSTATRWDYTNDAIAGWLVVSFTLLSGLHIANLVDLTTLPGTVFAAWVSFVGIALAWAFGPDAVAAWQDTNA